MKIINYLKLLHYVSDHRESIFMEPCTVLGYNYKNGSILSVDMDVVGVVAAYCNLMCVCVCVCSSLYRKALSAFVYSELHTQCLRIQ